MSNSNYDDSYVPYKKPGTKIQYTAEQIKELTLCSQDPLYFIEHYVKIVHPVKGLVVFKPYEYQKELIRCVNKYRNVVGLMSRQNGKTESVASYLLWYAMFHKNKTILIVANKRDTATEILDRIKNQ